MISKVWSYRGAVGLGLVALSLAVLTGCQGLAKNAANNNNVGGTVAANPASLSFGTVQLGANTSKSETITNTGSTAVTISQFTVSPASYSVSGFSVPITLNAGQSVTFNVVFAPSAAGAANGTLAITSDASNSPLNIALSGTGASSGQLAVSPTSLNFGNVVVGANASRSSSLSASGASVTVSSANSSSSEFVLSGITLPVTIAAGQSASFSVKFTPAASGTANATLTFTSNASNSPTTQSLTGTGTAAPQHWVDLSWSGSAGAVSYNVYRKLPTDPAYQQITLGDSNTVFTDSNVSAGQSYNYVVTAVDANNLESNYSNVALVTVPAP